MLDPKCGYIVQNSVLPTAVLRHAVYGLREDTAYDTLKAVRLSFAVYIRRRSRQPWSINRPRDRKQLRMCVPSVRHPTTLCIMHGASTCVRCYAAENTAAPYLPARTQRALACVCGKTAAAAARRRGGRSPRRSKPCRHRARSPAVRSGPKKGRGPRRRKREWLQRQRRSGRKRAHTHALALAGWVVEVGGCRAAFSHHRSSAAAVAKRWRLRRTWAKVGGEGGNVRQGRAARRRRPCSGRREPRASEGAPAAAICT